MLSMNLLWLDPSLRGFHRGLKLRATPPSCVQPVRMRRVAVTFGDATRGGMKKEPNKEPWNQTNITQSSLENKDLWITPRTGKPLLRLLLQSAEAVRLRWREIQGCRATKAVRGMPGNLGSNSGVGEGRTETRMSCFTAA